MWLVRKPWSCFWKARQIPGLKVILQREKVGKAPQRLAARDRRDEWDLCRSADGKRDC